MPHYTISFLTCNKSPNQSVKTYLKHVWIIPQIKVCFLVEYFILFPCVLFWDTRLRTMVFHLWLTSVHPRILQWCSFLFESILHCLISTDDQLIHYILPSCPLYSSKTLVAIISTLATGVWSLPWWINIWVWRDDDSRYYVIFTRIFG